MANTTFAKPFNNVATTVASPYTHGSGSLVVASTTGMALTAGQWLRVSTFHNGVPQSILKITAISGTTLTVAGAVDATVDVDLVVGDPVEMRITAGAFTDIHTSLARGYCNGRLTVASGVPVGNSATGTTLYFTPYLGNWIGLYDGTANWDLIPFVETSIAVPGSAGVYDVYGYNNAGSLALEFSTAWTTTGLGAATDGSRAVALSKQDGIYVKSTDTTRRYLGTIYSASGTCNDTPINRYVWNYYNRLQKTVIGKDTTPSYQYGNQAWRLVNQNNNWTIYIVNGVAESTINVNVSLVFVLSGSNTWYYLGVGYDRVNNNDANYGPGRNVPVSGMSYVLSTGIINAPHMGLHFYSGVEYYDSGILPTMYPASNPSGIVGLWFC